MLILYAYYGDDFTGSTDVLEQLGSNGIPAVLFLGTPTPEQLAAFPAVQAIGIAGDARSRSPEWMDANLPAIFKTLRSFGAPVNHYKVCSTFDSSPIHGSIGRAIELGIAVFHPRFVPIIVGAPHLRRFVLDRKLFAAGPDGKIHRIDRHPMRNHPVTPMREPDLARHLAAQTRSPIGHIPHDQINADYFHDQVEMTLLFDTTSAADLIAAGELIWHEAKVWPVFSASSSGLTAALIPVWRAEGLIPTAPAPQPIPRANPLLVLSGSCSPVTERQIRHALAHGFHGIPVDATAPQTALGPTLESLAAGKDTILYTALGDPGQQPHGDALGRALGQLLREILEQQPIRRVLLCGGDTSSHAIQQLDMFALTWLANLQPGAPLCQAHPSGLELVLKGGQVGTEDFFQVVRG
jgi:3-oxoisoapionate kinase